MGEAKHDGLTFPGRVVLAHEPPFHIGDLHIDPATRQVERGELRETLEPRVMQVLVALFRTDGIITRDELVGRCWDGRVVGDDAINRVISRLRHLADDIGGGRFSVETITKVGYRLNVAAAVAGKHVGQAAPGKPFASSRRKVAGALVAAGAAVLVGVPVAWRLLDNAPSPRKEAEELYRRALALRGSGRQGDNRQAIGYLKEAVRIDPEYGEAWGALALEYRDGLLDDPPEASAGFEERLQEALRQTDRYDPGNPDAAFARRLHGLFFGRWANMEPIYRELADRFPNHPNGHFLLGSLLMDVGRWSEAIEALRMAKAKNALAPIPRYKLTVALWSAGQISQAEQEIDEALRWSMHGAIWQTKIKLLTMTGRAEAALAIINDQSARPADAAADEYARHWRPFLTALISRAPDDVDRALSDLIQTARQDTDPVPNAFQCAVLGDKGTALAMLEGYYLGIGEWASKRPADPRGSASHPLFQPQARSLWNEPRFGRILNGIGLEKYWRATMTQPDYRRA